MHGRIAPQYRQFAEDCLNIATRINPNDREKLLRIAEIWLVLATEELFQASAQKEQQRGNAETLAPDRKHTTGFYGQFALTTATP